MKVRFYVTVDLPTQKTALEPKSKAEEKAWAEDYVTDMINIAFQGHNPTNPILRFPREPK